MPLIPPQGEHSSYFPNVPVRGSLPQKKVCHKLLQHESFQQVAVLAKLLQCGSLSWSAVLQEQTAPVQAFHRVTASFGHPSALVWDPALAAGGYLLHHETSMGCISCLSFSYLNVCRLFLLHILILLFTLATIVLA